MVLVEECSVFRYNNAFYCVAQGLVSAVDNFFHICVGLFCSISRSGTRWDWSQLYNSSSINFTWLRHFIQKQITYSKHYWQRNKNLPPVFAFKKKKKKKYKDSTENFCVHITQFLFLTYYIIMVHLLQF